MRYRILVANQYAKDSPWLLTEAAQGNGGDANPEQDEGHGGAGLSGTKAQLLPQPR